MLAGAYEGNSQAVVVFDQPACAPSSNGYHIVTAVITVCASQGGEVVMTQALEMPVIGHMDDAAILSMFQSQINSLPEYSGMSPS